MNKTQLENLIKRMNAPYEPEIKVSWEKLAVICLQ